MAPRSQDVALEQPRSVLQRVGDAYRAYVKKPLPPLGEISNADPYSFYGGRGGIYNPSELISVKGYYVIDQMRKDDQVKAALAFKKQSVLAAGWHIVPPEGKPKDWAPKVEVEKALYNCEGGFSRSLKEVMSALDYGFSVSEKVWEVVEGKARLKKLATRKPYDLTMISDPHGNLTSVEQQGKALPLDKLVIYSYDSEFSNHYGRSDLEAAYRAWWTKNNAYKWMAMMLERLGIPPIFALYNSSVYTSDQQTKLHDILKSMQAATVGAIPRPDAKDLEMWAPELAGQVSTVFLPAMEFFNKDISRALLMPGLIGMTQDDKQGSLARSQVHFDVFMLVLEDIRGQLSELVNERVIDDILAFNVTEQLEEDDKPSFEFMPLTDNVRLEILAQWNALVAGGVAQPQDSDEVHIRSMLKFPPPDERDVEERATRGAELAQALAPEPVAAPRGELVPEEKQSDEMKQFAEEHNGVWVYDAAGQAVCVEYAGWDEAKHPRRGKGDPRGGEFMPTEADSDSLLAKADQLLSAPAPKNLRESLRRERALFDLMATIGDHVDVLMANRGIEANHPSLRPLWRMHERLNRVRSKLASDAFFRGIGKSLRSAPAGSWPTSIE